MGLISFHNITQNLCGGMRSCNIVQSLSTSMCLCDVCLCVNTYYDTRKIGRFRIYSMLFCILISALFCNFFYILFSFVSFIVSLHFFCSNIYHVFHLYLCLPVLPGLSRLSFNCSIVTSSFVFMPFSLSCCPSSSTFH